MGDFDRESMMEMFTFEMSQLLEQLEQNIIEAESGYTMDKINEIFRIMHTIKGSAAMMLYNNISVSAHAIEDLFFYLREENPQDLDYSTITDLVLEGADFIKEEIGKLTANLPADGDGTVTNEKIKNYLKKIKAERAPATKPVQASTKPSAAGTNKLNKYSAKINFADGCEMENVRAFTLINNIVPYIENETHTPADLMNEQNIGIIRRDGFSLEFESKHDYDTIYKQLSQTVYLKDLDLNLLQAAANASDLEAFEVMMRFDEGSEMENVRAFTIVHNLKGKAASITHIPEDLIDEASADIIKKDGFKMVVKTSIGQAQLTELLEVTLFLRDLSISKISAEEAEPETFMEAPVFEVPQTAVETETQTPAPVPPTAPVQSAATSEAQSKKAPAQHVISVNVNKLDQLLKIMGELVIAEAMVTQNPELETLELESFHKEARQLRKIINDLQDTVMSMRMVPLSTTFFKMHRIVRDMCKQLGKDVNLNIIGEDTEVDKNIIEHISDPLMHIIRNSVDHGIEMPDKREQVGKDREGEVTLEAKNSGSDVLITVRDDGAGLNKDKIMEKARNNGLLKKPDNEYTDKEIYQFVFMPGFSTNEVVTSFSGRGVGMDVVSKNLELVGGAVIVDSEPGEGSSFTLKIPLTLAIIKGMTIKMGGSKYTIPIASIKDSFRPVMSDVFKDPDGNEMITVRGECYNIVRLYEFFNVQTEITNLEDGIMMMVENGDATLCLFVDDLVGEQQVVVKSMPKYIKRIPGLSGCTLLGNGDISLIIDIAGFFDK